MKAACHVKLGEKQESLASLNQVMEWKPEDIDLLLWQCEIAQETGDIPKTMEVVNKLLQLDPKNPRARNIKGTCHFQNGDYRQARIEFDAAVEGQPMNTVYLVNRSRSLIGLRDFLNALQDLDVLTRIDSNQAEHWEVKEMCHRALGQVIQAHQANLMALKIRAAQ
eukprot:Protomagalhaensia_sp_Gyna_25__2822@NODE_2635_length_973_cov_37_837259_g471_i2_p1_GENE_NODE_2635_length_973_cov_37_837259_g471_i2NODE_2635_length_973_cov_37_837259_g471_i2_p1_ORF_typecomplete_len173_score18_10TPR_9/PF13371_6/0_58TPR_9/PF13371_6/1_1e10TPR_9/PF13371_6/0_4TPR_19/PF14559_6/0_027TPR_19/PF14559_6/4_1e08TPR_19/PF14559_6/0_0022TPR_19/PF14559_6/9_9e02ANAPC3/PF12895_7/3_9ANAPC3/PF12895_7/2_9e08ANAPC3/PF12895_7/1_6TPR_16/PF13432_6/46TPR_16/PF13432_6/7_3e09TPR_16/PF13432_6/11TPR_15/PF13429_6